MSPHKAIFLKRHKNNLTINCQAKNMSEWVRASYQAIATFVATNLQALPMKRVMLERQLPAITTEGLPVAALQFLVR